MLQFYKDYFERLQHLHEEAKQALDGLEGEKLSRKPGPEMNSLCVLGTHIAGAERFWIGDVAMNDPSQRNRDNEFQAICHNTLEMTGRLDDSLSYIQRALDNLTLEELEKPRTTPDGRHVTVGWCLSHVLSHTALHVGHMQLTRQLLT